MNGVNDNSNSGLDDDMEHRGVEESEDDHIYTDNVITNPVEPEIVAKPENKILEMVRRFSRKKTRKASKKRCVILFLDSPIVGEIFD